MGQTTSSPPPESDSSMSTTSPSLPSSSSCPHDDPDYALPVVPSDKLSDDAANLAQIARTHGISVSKRPIVNKLSALLMTTNSLAHKQQNFRQQTPGVVDGSLLRIKFSPNTGHALCVDRKSFLFDLMPIVQARSTQITYLFSEKDNNVCGDLATSQIFVKGNIAILPQDTLQAQQYLPPSPEDIEQSVTVLSVGTDMAVNCETIFSKQKVKIVLEFLLAHNPWYRSSGNDNNQLPSAVTLNFVPPQNDGNSAMSGYNLQDPCICSATFNLEDDKVFEKEFQLFVKELTITYNWHEHTDTCWKHLKAGEPMHIDGFTCLLSEINPSTQSNLLRHLHPCINNFNDVVIFMDLVKPLSELWPLWSNGAVEYRGQSNGVQGARWGIGLAHALGPSMYLGP
ncbi:hypothetical protein SERLA73DRAFT_150231 [Serpula lacrymans var. lacrymans S7.3]|uniref:DUF6570 domain-containing protein n=1 Tax=Serpula lacrymans var. lacrymans (strain S7.3) TaxID=936435 RepID=F8PLM3_SERL3|nr:hypothetical protein SERLA73DRAFT_150231 [Serpula lacrymans var. lacrymans S7.3]